MKIWLVSLKMGGLDNKKSIAGRKYCIEKNLLCMAWRVNTDIPESYEAYEKEYEVLHGSDEPNDIKSMRYAFERYNGKGKVHLEKDDLCLTSEGNRYYIGRVMDDQPIYATDSNYPGAKNYGASWCRLVDKWHEIGGITDTPAAILSQLCARHHKTIDVRWRDSNPNSTALYSICETIYNEKIGKTNIFTAKIPITESNFLIHISSDDLEDLVGLYLQYELGYLLYPSSCKMATAEIEYALIDRDTGKVAVVQVKKRDREIDIETYAQASYQDKIVYLFQENDKYTHVDRLSDVSNVVLLERRVLFDFFVEHKSIFAKRLHYVTQMYTFV